ncbi:hypothetical protein [Nocardia sp. NPDC060259]|uniref:hypothetical protein n=1 Tax=Nocardia sp. NPDC060259 TaxID=3347088 RepID=UPI003669D10B
MVRILVATAAVAGIAAGASPAVAAPAAPGVIAEGSVGTGSALIDFPLGFLKFILCHGAGGPSNPICA